MAEEAGLLDAITELRAEVAAVGRPDEGMRGTAADALKLRTAADADHRDALARALLAAARDETENGHELAEAASAVIRSISVTSSAASEVAPAVAGACCAALRARRGLPWLLAALVRLGQHVETHPALVAVGAVPALLEAWAASAGEATVSTGRLELGAFATGTAARLDLVACVFLSFISESDAAASAAGLVPPEVIAPFVNVLRKRLALAPGPADAERMTSQGYFFGLPLYYRPRFMVQALANLAARDDAHCAAAWDTKLPAILRGLYEGELANDTGDNVPYGSPDAVECARGLAASLLRWRRSHGDGTSVTPEELAALKGLAHGPTNGRPGWTFRGGHFRHTNFRGCSAVSDSIAYIAGSGGTVLRTADAGESWVDVSPPGLGELEFRDVVAIDADSAYLLSVGPGEASRILRTHSAGADWEELFVNREEAAFYSALKFWPDRRHGIAFSDSVEGCFRIIVTDDCGESWSVVPGTVLPPALDGEGAFAASGKNIVVREGGGVWIGMGAAPGHARVLHSGDFGATWSVSATPIPSSKSAGIFSIDFADDLRGVAVGGDYTDEDRAGANVAVTADGGVSWVLASDAVGGFRSVVQYIELPPAPSCSDGQAVAVYLAVGPSGADVSEVSASTGAGGLSWTPVQTPCRGLHTFSQAAGASQGFSAGARGGIATLRLSEVLAAP